MLACYRSRDWTAHWRRSSAGRRTDEAHTLARLFDLYEARILAYQASPPDDDWNGAYALLTK